ncbi:Com family DNA-binding transcriptional regulator [Syntrophomonas erecta]
MDAELVFPLKVILSFIGFIGLCFLKRGEDGIRDFRCKKCNKLLGRCRGEYELEIKCPRCGFINYLYNRLTIKRNLCYS